MRLSPWVITHTEQVLREVLQFSGPADVVISRYFREHAKLGMRERGAFAETVYAILRNRLVYNHLSESGAGPAMRRLVLLGLADVYGPDAMGGVSDDERDWLEHVMKIDRSRLPKKMQANLPDWLYDRLLAQYGEEETQELSRVLNTPAPLDLRAQDETGRSRQGAQGSAGRVRSDAVCRIRYPPLQENRLAEYAAVQGRRRGSAGRRQPVAGTDRRCEKR